MNWPRFITAFGACAVLLGLLSIPLRADIQCSTVAGSSTVDQSSTTALSNSATDAVCSGAGGAVTSSLETGLIAFWSLDGAVGADKRANAGGSCGSDCNLTANNGPTAVGAKTAALGGTSDGAALFDKTAPQPFYSTGDSSEWAGLTAATWSIWIYRDTVSDFDDLFGVYGSSDNAFGMRINSSNTLPIEISNSGTGTDNCVTLTAPVASASTWYHIVVVYDGSAGTSAERCDIYVNNALIANTSVGTVATSLRDSGNDYRIGYRQSVYFDGRLDAHGMWNVGLSTDQIASLFNGLGSGDGVQYPFTGIAWNLLTDPAWWQRRLAALGQEAYNPYAKGSLEVPAFMLPDHHLAPHCAKYPEAPVCG